MADRRTRTRRRTITVAATVAALAVVGAVGYGYAVPSTGAAASYRTVSPTRGDVAQAITATGTLTPVSQVTASFPTAGRITAVLVHAGQRVSAGQKLATMDTTPLEAAVLNAQATVAQDEVAIETDNTAISTGSTTSASVQSGGAPTTAAATTKPSVTASPAAPRSSASPSHPSGAPSGPAGGGSSTLLAGVTSAQQLADQACSRVLTGLAFGGGGARNASAPLPGTASPTPSNASPSASSPSASVSASSDPSASSTVGSSTPSPSATVTSAPPSYASPTSASPTSASPTSASAPASGAPSSPHASATPSFSRSPSGQPSTGGGASQQELSACLTSLSQLATAERGAARALQASIASQGTATGRTSTSQSTTTTSRTAAGSTSARTSTTSSSGGRTSTAAGNATSSGTGSGGSRAGGPGGSLTPAAQLLQDQGQLATDQQTLSQAQQHLDAATLAAPIAGVVAQVSLTPGATASTTQGVTIIGSGAATVATTIPLAQMPKVALGDTVQVDPVGSTTTLSGTVTTIGVLPASTSGSSPTYPLTVTIDSGSEGLPSGDVARVSIVTASVKDALTVPESALVATGQGAGTVTVLEGGSTSTVTVSTGAIGSGRVQVLSGLSPAASVVIANLSEPLPSNTGFAGRAGAAVGGITRQVRG